MTVIWAIPPGSKWDQNIIHRAMSGDPYRWPIRPANERIVVVPGAEASRGEIPDVIDDESLVIVTSDEARLFDISSFAGRVMVQTPDPNRQDEPAFGFALGAPPLPPGLVTGHTAPTKGVLWSFLGQDTHQRRHDAIAAMRRLDDGVLLATDGFARGIDRVEYHATLRSSIMVPCPSGPATVDTFRVWEAIEAGAIPIVDTRTPSADQADYWVFENTPAFHLPPPLPRVTSWRDLGDVIYRVLPEWPTWSAVIQAWWGQERQMLERTITEDQIARYGHGDVSPVDQIGVLVFTSPIPSHPSTAMIEETIASVRHHLPNAPITISCDGVRPEQQHMEYDYGEYLRNLTWLATHHWTNVVVEIMHHHEHQSGMARAYFKHPICEPLELVLMMEHDTPLTTDPIEWGHLASLIESSHFDLIRLHHEASVLDAHRHLMLGDGPLDRVWRTMQWSQRPHLASTDWYRNVVLPNFDDKTFIEDRMHSVVQVAHHSGHPNKYRLGVYCPSTPSIKRSYHLDGRAGGEKYL